MFVWKIILLAVFVVETVIGQQDLQTFKNKQFLVNSFPLLHSANVRMKDKNAVFQKINKIIEGKTKSLRIISDFDQTLTVQHINGTSSLTSYEVLFQNNPKLASEFGKEMDFLKHYLIKDSRNHTLEENVKVLNKFSKRQKNKLMGLNFNSEMIAELAKNYGPHLRNRTRELFKDLEVADIPILVFSAGIGDVVEAMLKSQNAMTSNVKVIANFLKFDNSKISGFQGSGVHTFNKNLRIDEGGDSFVSDWRFRTNVIVMGDNLGDASMADGFENAENVLKIGFLYRMIDERLPDFEETFDVVLIDDQTMDIPIEIVSGLLDR